MLSWLTSEDKRPDILIVDDDTTVVITLRKVLSKIGRIRFAANAEQAFDMINDERPDLILLDMQLPDMDGLSICKQLKNQLETKRIPILFITSNIDEGFEEKVFDAGAADYIVKPLNPRVVAARTQIHIAYYKAMNRLNRQAHTDGLTGLANRCSFDEKLTHELKRTRRQQDDLTLVMVDIDEFKKYNDHFGHLAGDDCIKIVAHTLSNLIKRPADLAARYGGEEFALILPHTDNTGARTLIQNILNAIEELKIDHAPEADKPYITVSVGYSTYSPSTEHNASVSNNEVIQAADKALYESKHAGRNCYHYHPLKYAAPFESS